MTNKSISHNIVKFIIQILTICISFSFFAICLVPYLSPEKFWWVGLAGLASPYIIVLLLFSILFWLFAKPMWAITLLIVFLLGYRQVSVVFAFHFKTSFSEKKDSSSIRIVDWNLRGFNGLNQGRNTKKMVRTELAESILKLNPDVICLQEFNHSYNTAAHPHLQANNIDLFMPTHPYNYFSKDYKAANGYTAGSIIFSRYPIIDSGRIKFPKGESALYIDIKKDTDTIRIYTTHLQSFKFKKNDYENIDKVENNDSAALTASKNVLEKMKPTFKKRAIQADILKEWLNKSPYSSIIAGDFNDVPNSYTYFTIRSKRQDAFLQKSFGIGRTFVSLAPTLRIDYILPDKSFIVKQFELEDEGLSDHFMLVADVKKL